MTKRQTGLAAVLMTFGLASAVMAQLSIGYRVEPLRTELSGQAGQTLKARMVVTPPASEEPAAVNIEFVDHSLEPLKGLPWMEFPSGRHDVKPGDTLSLDYTVTIPPDAKGELFGRVIIADANEGEDVGMLTIRTRLSVPIYVVIEGTQIYTGRIQNVVVDQVNPPDINFEVMNEGNLSVRSLGFADIIDVSTGKKVLFKLLGNNPAVFFPGHASKMTVSFDRMLPPGKYEARIKIPFPSSEEQLFHVTPFTIAPPSKESGKETENKEEPNS